MSRLHCYHTCNKLLAACAGLHHIHWLQHFLSLLDCLHHILPIPEVSSDTVYIYSICITYVYYIHVLYTYE